MNLIPPGFASLLPLISFMAIQSITPGPNNLLLAAAGAGSGFRATIPHLLGITTGMAIQIAVLAAGLAPLLSARPEVLHILTVVSVLYLLWLATRLVFALQSVQDRGTPGGARPMRFVEAAIFQWINPKAWMMSLTVAGALWPHGRSFSDALLLIIAVTMTVNLPCISVWAAGGTLLRTRLQHPRHWRMFNSLMSAGLIVTAVGLLDAM